MNLISGKLYKTLYGIHYYDSSIIGFSTLKVYTPLLYIDFFYSEGYPYNLAVYKFLYNKDIIFVDQIINKNILNFYGIDFSNLFEEII